MKRPTTEAELREHLALDHSTIFTGDHAATVRIHDELHDAARRRCIASHEHDEPAPAAPIDAARVDLAPFGIGPDYLPAIVTAPLWVRRYDEARRAEAIA